MARATSFRPQKTLCDIREVGSVAPAPLRSLHLHPDPGEHRFRESRPRRKSLIMRRAESIVVFSTLVKTGSAMGVLS